MSANDSGPDQELIRELILRQFDDLRERLESRFEAVHADSLALREDLTARAVTAQAERERLSSSCDKNEQELKAVRGEMAKLEGKQLAMTTEVKMRSGFWGTATAVVVLALYLLYRGAGAG